MLSFSFVEIDSFVSYIFPVLEFLTFFSDLRLEFLISSFLEEIRVVAKPFTQYFHPTPVWHNNFKVHTMQKRIKKTNDNRNQLAKVHANWKRHWDCETIFNLYACFHLDLKLKAPCITNISSNSLIPKAIFESVPTKGGCNFAIKN